MPETSTPAFNQAVEPCPACGQVALPPAITGQVPPALLRAGAYTICAQCGAVLRLTEAFSFRRVTDEEWAVVPEPLQYLLSAHQRAARVLIHRRTCPDCRAAEALARTSTLN